MNCDFVYRDENILIVTKPAGFETIVKGSSGGKCFTSDLRRRLDLPDLKPVHRLDRDTTGAQVFSCNKKTLRAVEDIFRKHQAQKTYLALCLGVPRNDTGKICRNLSKWEGGRRPVRVVKGKGGLAAETAYQLLCGNKELGKLGSKDMDAASLIAFMPFQGRTHQIRVHSAEFGFPILGDDQYGKRPANRTAGENLGIRRQALHAWRLSFTHPITGKEMSLESPLPDDMREAAKLLFPDKIPSVLEEWKGGK